MANGRWSEALRKEIAPGGWALVPLRLVLGFGFAAHGYAKLARGPETFAPIVAALGMPAPGLIAWATSVIEFAGGILMMLGAFVVPLSVPLAAIMLTAMFGVHLRYGFSSIRIKSLTEGGAAFGPIGYELTLLYLAGIATLALAGPTPFSVDRGLESRRQRMREAAAPATVP